MPVLAIPNVKIMCKSVAMRRQMQKLTKMDKTMRNKI